MLLYKLADFFKTLLQLGQYYINFADVFLAVHIYKDLDYLFSAHPVFVPTGHVIQYFVTLSLSFNLSTQPRSQAEVISEFIKSHSFLLVVLTEEGKHIFVLSDKVVVKEHLNLLLLSKLSRAHLCDHVRVVFFFTGG